MDEYGDLQGTYDAEGINAIADALRVHGGLTSVNLSDNMLGEEGTKAICEAFEQNTMLKELNISGGLYGASSIGGPAGAKHVAKMLGVNGGGLTKLSISANHVGDEGVGAICEAIQSNKENKLVSLDMSYNSIGQEGVKSVATMVAITDGLTSVDLFGNHDLTRSDYRTGMTGIKELAAALGVNGGLTEVR